MNDRYRGHRPRLLDSVRKRMRCEICGASWDRGRTPPGPCPGPADRIATPVLGTSPHLRGGLYRGKVKSGT